MRDSIISCAEYQLFIDERRARGDYRQPDHWRDTHFQAGSARAPVLGVRASDAEQFCEWLTGRESGAWTYSLPEQDLGDKLDSTAGYWITSPMGPRLGAPPVRQLLTLDTLQQRLKADRATLESGPKTGIDRNLALELDLNLAFHLGLHRAIDRARNRDLAIDLARDLALGLGRDLTRALDSALERVLIHERDLTRAVARVRLLFAAVHWPHREPRWYEFSRWRRSAPNIDYFYRVLDAYLALVILEERIEGKLPAIEGIRITKVRKSASSPETILQNKATQSAP